MFLSPLLDEINEGETKWAVTVLLWGLAGWPAFTSAKLLLHHPLQKEPQKGKEVFLRLRERERADYRLQRSRRRMGAGGGVKAGGKRKRRDTVNQ